MSDAGARRFAPVLSLEPTRELVATYNARNLAAEHLLGALCVVVSAKRAIRDHLIAAAQMVEPDGGVLC